MIKRINKLKLNEYMSILISKNKREDKNYIIF